MQRELMLCTIVMHEFYIYILCTGAGLRTQQLDSEKYQTYVEFYLKAFELRASILVPVSLPRSVIFLTIYRLLAREVETGVRSSDGWSATLESQEDSVFMLNG